MAARGGRKGNRAPIIFLCIILVVLALYTAYWFVVRTQVERLVDDWISTEREAGAEIEYAGKSFGGFPYRVSMEFEDFKYRPAGQGTVWEGERLQATMLAWNFYHYILRSPGQNKLTDTLTGELTEIDLRKKSALSLTLTADGQLDKLVVAVDEADIMSPTGAYQIDGFGLQFGLVDETPEHARLAVAWDAIELPEDVVQYDWLGTSLKDGGINIEFKGMGSVIGEQPLLPRWRDADGRIEVAQIKGSLGPVKLGMKGNFKVSPDGLLNGPLQFRLEDGSQLFETLKAQNMLTREQERTFEILLSTFTDDKFASINVRDSRGEYLFFTLFELPTAQFFESDL